MKRAALLGVVLVGLLGRPAPLHAQVAGSGGSGGGGAPGCVAIAPGAPAQVVLGTTVTLTGTCCSPAAAVPAVGSYRWLLAALLLALIWRLGPRYSRRGGVLIVLALLAFADKDRPAAGGTDTCALTWEARSAFEDFTGTGAQFSFTPTIAASFQITLGSGSAVATQTLTVVPAVWLWQSAVPSASSIEAFWGTAPDDVWAVGAGSRGSVMHWDGVAWQQVASNTISGLFGIWGSSADDVWAVGGFIGGSGAFNMIHWDGQAWSPVSAGTSDSLTGVWGSGPNDVWAVAGTGIITHFDGSSWQLSVTRIGVTELRSIWGSGPSDVWAVGTPHALHPTSDDQSILHWSGSGWDQVVENSPSAQAQVLQGVWAAPTGEAWAAAFGAVLQWNGTAWAPSSVPSGFYYGVWGRAANDVWVVGNGILHFDGGSWINQASNIGTVQAVGGVSTPPDSSPAVWAATQSALFRLVPGATPTCEAIQGTCTTSCPAGQGHVSDYPCANGGVCCVSAAACGGSSEPGCCSRSTNTFVPGLRPICRDGAYSCGPDAFPTNICGPI